MSPYSGKFAEWYDTFYAAKPYDNEASFLDRCLQKYAPGRAHRVLELACGTGTHAFALERLGYKVVATDVSRDMIARAREKAAKLGSTVEFRQADMRCLDLQDEPFDAVLCLFDSLGYVVTNEAVREALQNVHNHLRPDGLFICEYWHGAAMLRGFEPTRVRRWSLPDGEVLRLSETTLQYSEQAATVDYTMYYLGNDGRYFRLEEKHVNRYFGVPEMIDFLTTEGLIPIKSFAGFADDEAVSDSTWHIVVVAQRRG